MPDKQHSLIIEENETVELTGSVQFQTNIAPPFFSDIEPNNPENERHWFINLGRHGPIAMRWYSPENGDPIVTDDIKIVQLAMKDGEMYNKYRPLVNSGRQITVTGKMFPRMTAHHHGDALIAVESIREAN